MTTNKVQIIDFAQYGYDFPGPFLWAKFYDHIWGTMECHLPFSVCLDCLHILNVTTAEILEKVDGTRFLVIEVEQQEWDGTLTLRTWTQPVHDFAANNLPHNAADIVTTAWNLALDGDRKIFEMFFESKV